LIRVRGDAASVHALARVCTRHSETVLRAAQQDRVLVKLSANTRLTHHLKAFQSSAVKKAWEESGTFVEDKEALSSTS
jgi:hypothetical protein